MSMYEFGSTTGAKQLIDAILVRSSIRAELSILCTTA